MQIYVGVLFFFSYFMQSCWFIILNMLKGVHILVN